jgi:hypothetical protein
MELAWPGTTGDEGNWDSRKVSITLPCRHADLDHGPVPQPSSELNKPPHEAPGTHLGHGRMEQEGPASHWDPPFQLRCQALGSHAIRCHMSA